MAPRLLSFRWANLFAGTLPRYYCILKVRNFFAFDAAPNVATSSSPEKVAPLASQKALSSWGTIV
jgi:hypothetical protein